ncbi:hypothetical protein BKA70DRAFT_1245971 [Coprinopsis sp. MPI-PUGE-AT-0042]|nr:hypothetical protein BKA70DRAFT_1245971 [Coprinopsis sp. MPI-PUGE-AT-0042]
MLRQTLVYIALVTFAAQRVAAVIPVGGLCSGIAGPIPDRCEKGSVCCVVGPDRSLCTVTGGRKCPSHFIEEGGLCAGIAGPSPYPCIAGTTCCYLSPDNAVCLDRCG